MEKLAYQEQSQIFEKVVKNNGRVFCVRFVIVDRGGKLRGKVISCEEIRTIRTPNTVRKYEQQIAYLPRGTKNIKRVGRTIHADADVSPYVSFAFFISQMPRAPALR